MGVLGDLSEAITCIRRSYEKETPNIIRLLDIFLWFLLIMGMMQLMYAFVIGTTFPFNSLLSGLFSCIGAFTLTLNLRLQLADMEKLDISTERAFADYLLCNFLLFMGVFTLMG
eukprot:GHVS01086423.1.p1 GENE.GHVS01086423.1~~GHVS01086423.1.p1  ORF type:complete len:114 (+),score=8.98 GHVS01086423.1:105-446(+)